MTFENNEHTQKTYKELKTAGVKLSEPDSLV